MALAVSAAGAVVAAPQELSAVWTPKELTFTYLGHTTKYTCDGLRDKVRGMLIALGARSDLQVNAFGCIRPEPLPGVRIKMNVLEPAGQGAGQAVAAHWKTVDLLAHRDLLDAAGDCELVAQLRQVVLPLFATRNVDASSTCQYRQLPVGTTRLKADVLIPDEQVAPASAAR